jgi:hypothetical protein
MLEKFHNEIDIALGTAFAGHYLAEIYDMSVLRSIEALYLSQSSNWKSAVSCRIEFELLDGNDLPCSLFFRPAYEAIASFFDMIEPRESFNGTTWLPTGCLIPKQFPLGFCFCSVIFWSVF